MAEIVPNRVPCGKKPTPTPTPKPEPKPSTLCDLTGVKYFKLQSDILGDYTKNCGLLGNEIDENFYFLRSMDIVSGYTTVMDDGKKMLILNRVNCHPDIEIDITDISVLEMHVDDGYLFVNGDKVKDTEGNPVKFLLEGSDVHVVTDSSIQGDGSCENPLGVDLAYRTGTYAPADFYVDFTCDGRKLDDYKYIGYSHAIVTKELASRFGALYTYEQVKAIAKDLGDKDCHWRVPSVEDWGKLLDAAEPNEKSRNHNTRQTGNFGCVAGNRLKSTDFWYVEEPAEDPVDDFGMAIYPVGVCPEVYNTKDPDEYGFMGLYGVTSFWESGETEGQAYTRTFSYGHDDVAQFLESKASRRSVRLVMDVNDDFDVPQYATILDNYVEVVYVPEAKQLWTKNIGFKNYVGYDEKQVTVPNEWAEVKYDETGTTFDMLTETKFYYNAWDGKNWHKKMMREGESVVLLYEDFEPSCDTAATPYVTSANTNHEWRVFVNPDTGLDELVDTVEALKEEMEKEFEEIYELISGVSDNLNVLSGVVIDNEEVTAAALNDLNRRIKELSGNTSGEIEALSASVVNNVNNISVLSGVVIDNEEVTAAALNDLNKRIKNLSGVVEDMQEEQGGLQNEIDAIEEAVGLNEDGSHKQPEGAHTSACTTVEDEIKALDDALVEVENEIEELKSKSIEPLDASIIIEATGDTTYIGVQLDENDKHLKLGESGIWFDGEFKDTDEEDEDLYD